MRRVDFKLFVPQPIYAKQFFLQKGQFDTNSDSSHLRASIDKYFYYTKRKYKHNLFIFQLV